MRQLTCLLSLVLLAAAAPPAVQAAVAVTRLEGFNKTWQFINTDAVYDEIEYPNGYYKDYNADGLPDYLVCLKASKGGSMRLFTLNTAASGGDKTYATHKTAGRDFTASPGAFMPHYVFTPRAPKADTPDLVVAGSNSTASSAECTNFTFHRLNKTDKAWATEKQWTITMPFKAVWVAQWPEYSYDSDDYPDFFIYNSVAPTGNRRFVLGYYNGQTGTLIWQRTLNLAPEDTGSAFPGMPSTSDIIIHPLPLLPVGRVGNGDFDNDGKPEIYCLYSYMTFDMEAGEMGHNMMINVLNSSGVPLPPYSASWTRLGPANAATSLLPSPNADYDQDGFRDLIVVNPNYTPNSLPVFQGYSLKKRMTLFSSTNTDFGNGIGDAAAFRTIEPINLSRYNHIDMTGDGKRDLHVYRDKGVFTDDEGDDYPMPLKIGLFHTVAGGRKMWLSSAATFANFDRAHMLANDFNYDDIYDFALFKNPTSPGAPTWTIGNTAITASGATLGKQFTYTSSASGLLGVDQEFFANSVVAGNLGDMDNNGQRDTWASLAWEIEDGGVTKRAGGSVVIYNTPPPSSSASASRYAALDVLVSNEDWTPYLMLNEATHMNNWTFVDNDKDSVTDDVTIWGTGVICALNFKTQGSYPAAGQAGSPTPAHGANAVVGAPLRWEPFDGAYEHSTYDVYLGASQSAVSNATRASAEFKGNLHAPLYLPRPALEAGKTYYWRVDTYNNWGKVTKGQVWRLGPGTSVTPTPTPTPTPVPTNAVGEWGSFE